MTNANDPAGLSSEELLRQAREEFASPTSDPTAAEPAGQSTEPAQEASPLIDGPAIVGPPAVPDSSPLTSSDLLDGIPQPEAEADPALASEGFTSALPDLAGPAAPAPAPRQVAPPPWDANTQPRPPSGQPPAPRSGPAPMPARTQPNPWIKRGLIAAAVVVVMGVIGFVGRGTTSAQSLSVGSCYEAPSGGDEFSSLKDQDCALAHDMQIYGEVTETEIEIEIDGLGLDVSDDAREILQNGGAFSVPGQLPTQAQALDICDEIITDLALNSGLLDNTDIVIPDDTGISFLEIFDRSENLEKYFCILDSPSGQLVGSVFDG